MGRARSSPRPVIAEIIAVGSELLLGGRTDSNSLFITDELGTLGIEVRFKSVVGDDRADIVRALKTAVSRAEIIVMTGGLGPTVDDCTREAIADAAGRKLARRKEAFEGMQKRLAQWGRSPNKGQLRQALIPTGATVVPNPVGSAPGFWLNVAGRHVDFVTGRASGNGGDDARERGPCVGFSIGGARPHAAADQAPGVSYVGDS